MYIRRSLDAQVGQQLCEACAAQLQAGQRLAAPNVQQQQVGGDQGELGQCPVSHTQPPDIACSHEPFYDKGTHGDVCR